MFSSIAGTFGSIDFILSGKRLPEIFKIARMIKNSVWSNVLIRDQLLDHILHNSKIFDIYNVCMAL